AGWDGPPLGGQPLAPARTPRGHDLASALGGHARAVTVTALAYKLARLIGPLHDRILRWSRPGGGGKTRPQNRQKPRLCPGRHLEFARLIREGARAVNATRRASRHPEGRLHHAASNAGETGRSAVRLVYIAEMSAASLSGSVLLRRVLPLVAVVALAAAVTWAAGRGSLSLEALIRHRSVIDAIVHDHAAAAVLAYIGIYIVTVSLSVPGA